MDQVIAQVLVWGEGETPLLLEMATRPPPPVPEPLPLPEVASEPIR